MSNNKKKQLTPVQQEYQELQKKDETQRPIVKNCIKAFLTGGIICLIGQAIQLFYIYYFNFTEQTAGNPTVGTLIFISMLLTGFGVYDRIA
ncbi:SpoVA/SpoVAEb family sporulation membrane protein, partial [Priestia endophytica]|uniref:SpoVA/SpoVAEb family sporulation membrane protein n=1 Tax=Priestia endophytica TaxID=135735 RepID=UPI00227DFB61